MDGRPCRIYHRDEERGAEEELNSVGGGTGGDLSSLPCPSHTPLVACDKDGGMADGAAVHSQRGGELGVQ